MMRLFSYAKPRLFRNTLSTALVTALVFGLVSMEVSALRLRSNLTPSKPFAVSTYANVTDFTFSIPTEYADTFVPSEETLDLLAFINTGTAKLNIRSGPGVTYEIIDTATQGDFFPVISVENGWCQINLNGAPAFMYTDYLLLMTAEEYELFQESADYAREEIVAFSKKYLGCSYVYGGNGPDSFDCSGFTCFVYKNFGYSINRGATGQLSNGTEITKNELLPGDLVFFRRSGTVKPVSHVGIYIGDGSFIHASTSGYQVRIDSLASGYYSDVYVYGRRIVS